ncbi:hypothetical protein D3C76_1740300 [compost metagenome]
MVGLMHNALATLARVQLPSGRNSMIFWVTPVITSLLSRRARWLMTMASLTCAISGHEPERFCSRSALSKTNTLAGCEKLTGTRNKAS